MNSVCWSCLKALSIFFFRHILLSVFFLSTRFVHAEKMTVCLKRLTDWEVKYFIENRKTTNPHLDAKVLHPSDYIWRSLFDQEKTEVSLLIQVLYHKLQTNLWSVLMLCIWKCEFKTNSISCLLFELHSIQRLSSLFFESVDKDLIKNKPTLDSNRSTANGWTWWFLVDIPIHI